MTPAQRQAIRVAAGLETVHAELGNGILFTPASIIEPVTILETNLIPNPSAEVSDMTGTTSASSVGLNTRTYVGSNGWFRYGTRSMLYTVQRNDAATLGLIVGRTPIGAAGAPITPSDWYAFRASAFVALADSPISNFRAVPYFWQASGAASAITPSGVGAAVSPVVGTQYDLYGNFQAPSDAAFASVGAVINVSPGGVTSNYQIYTDALALMDLGTTAPPSSGSTSQSVDVPAYFDGSFGADASGSYTWQGTPHASMSDSFRTRFGIAGSVAYGYDKKFYPLPEALYDGGLLTKDWDLAAAARDLGVFTETQL